MDSYTTIEKYASYEYEDRKSVFIADIAPVSTEAEALNFIKSVKKKYPDARHHVYAYVLRENRAMRYSDDGEPQGTAGVPILDVIRKNGCTDTVAVVTRYFGGTLLGTGGLVRAYTSSVAGAILKANIITYDVYRAYQIILSYSDYQKIGTLLADFDFRAEDTDYQDKVIINGRIIIDSAESFEDKITEITGARASLIRGEEKFDY